MRRCMYCRSEVADSASASTSEVQCDKCKKNEQKYRTKPTVCMYCQLTAAFVDNKCVWCCHGERKYGLPVSCAQCLLKAAFVRKSSQKDKPQYCRLCMMTRRANGVDGSSSSQKLTNVNNRHKRRQNDSYENKTKISRRSTITETAIENAQSEHIFLIQQYKDEILDLQKKCAEKDKVILERDKKIAELNAERIMQEQDGKTKITQMQRQHNESLQALHEQIRSLNKQVRQLQKGY